MKRKTGWGVGAVAGLVLAVAVGIVGWRATQAGVDPVPMTAPTTRVDATSPGPPVVRQRTLAARSGSGPIPVDQLMTESVLTQEQLDRVAWTGGGIVSCDISAHVPDPDSELTIGVPALLDRWASVDLASVSSGQRWPLLYIVAQRSEGRATVLVEGESTSTLTVAWSGANSGSPVECYVVENRPATPIHIEMPDYVDSSDSLIGVVGCGQAVEVTASTTRPILVSEPCQVWAVRSVGVATSYSPGVLLSPDGPTTVQVELPGYPVMLDPAGIEWVLDRLAQEGAEQTEGAVLELVDILSDPSGVPADEIRKRVDDIGAVYSPDPSGL